MGKGDTLESAPPATAYRSVMEEYGYEVGKVIGNGSYGTVYEAYYTKQKVMVAVKIISKKKASEDYLNKFLPREIQVMKVLRHKYLINFYQAIETTSRVYIILELAQGGDVLEWIQRYGACSEPLAGKWFSQMTLGIAYLHSKGIVHRTWSSRRYAKPPSVPPSWTSSRIPGCSSFSLSKPPMRSGCSRPCASPPAPLIVTSPWKLVPESG